MRSLRLARIAAEAEGLRLRSQIQRNVGRIVYALIALVFLLVALAFLHIGVWFWLRLRVGLAQTGTGFAIMGADFLIALGLLLMAMMSGPSRVERDALEVRRRALQNAASTAAVSTALVPALRVAVGLLRKQK